MAMVDQQVRTVSHVSKDFVGYYHDAGEPCDVCDEIRAKVRAAILSPSFSHTRARSWCGAWTITVYHHDDTSPTGVLMAMGCEEVLFDEVMADLRAAQIAPLHISPLSPTEGLRSSR